ncbi:putative lipid II flippase FtsW [Gracilibacillus caseinilyticus]|uniref:Probable peptidoglycan glycosyltransferase FtsW n=1 Tax=Gracilibacillus caseinilyticus TaxID=2932256 RepID=A0ABY4F2D9_9BACI|nr:putative lipid II flippase FtsW [Gracilibacillus caseinilyticus]UOQ50401.1 putative lipid II flippase FtsW [Gracilibacillus caseinilyticus]
MQYLKRMDLTLLIAVVLFIFFGVTMVYSASSPYALIRFDNAEYYFHRQLYWALLGLLFLIPTIVLPYKLYGKLVSALTILTILLLVLVLIPQIGVERNYSSRWLSIGGILLQPVEITKLTILIYFSYFYSKNEEEINNVKKGLLPPLIILAIVFCLIISQPDLGSATLIIFSCGIILFFTEIRLRYLILLMCFALLGFSCFALMAPYRLMRITSFLAPFEDMDGAGYQLVNSYISIHSGGVTGLGLGQSVQKHGYLPEAHTDFIMSIIAEELGFIGVLLVLGFYFFFFVKGIRIGMRAKNNFGKLLAVGITLQIVTQAFINLGAVSGTLPITGIPLPFLSYGGSSLLISIVSVGILLNISCFRRI